MKKLRKEDIDQQVFDLYDDYAHNRLDRRQFVEKLSTYAVGGITLPSLLSFIMPDYEQKILVGKDDERLNTEFVHYTSAKGAGDMRGQLSRPREATGKLPGIIVVHENQRTQSTHCRCRTSRRTGRLYFPLPPMRFGRWVAIPGRMMKVEPCSVSGIATKCWRISSLPFIISLPIPNALVRWAW